LPAVAAAPYVSIVMATHHRPEKLRRALQSLLRQDYPRQRLEIVVVACAGDAGIEVVEELAALDAVPCRCVVLPDTPANRYSAAAKRNHGVQQSHGQWLAFIDDDCLADSDWISGAAPLFADEVNGAVEGAKVVPPLARPTVTYNGMKGLSCQGGYQTCNMFYRRDVFERIGGFDLNFPFYLEDSDLAWAVLDAGYAIPHAPQSRVCHPAPDAAPLRMLHDSRRAILIPYLYKKHPRQFKASDIRALRASHWAYLGLYAALAICLAAGAWQAAAGVAGAIVLMLVAHNVRLFRGCRVNGREWLLTNLLLPVLPVVKVVQLVRGNVRYRVWLWS
jgi:GT2 family glycosyltransferase